MKKHFVAAILMMLSQTSMADGWSNLHGTSKGGDRLLIYPQAYYDGVGVDEDGLYIIVAYKGNSTRVQDIAMRYRDQICNHRGDKKTQELLFSCEKSGKSPLSGAIYKVVSNKNDRDCSYQYMYICVEGCENPMVPQSLTKDYWECPEGAE